MPHSRVLAAETLGGGLRNANLKLTLDPAREPVVLRMYEQDASLCRKELDLLRMLHATVPVPEVIHAAPDGLDELPPFSLSRFIEGVSFREVVHGGDRDAIAQAARSAGETLAAIGRIAFPGPGWLGPGPTVGAPLLEGADPIPRFIDLCFKSQNLQGRVPMELRDRTHAMSWSHAPRLACLDEAVLVHGDFNRRNLLVRRVAGRSTVVAVLDWEFAVSGTPLADVGNFLRYERADRPLVEPHFSTGFLGAGGQLPADWRLLARLVDLVALSESLTRDELPDDVAAELVELVHATVEYRDPQLW